MLSHRYRMNDIRDYGSSKTGLGFSISTNRPVAIAGLERRLINAFEISGGFGLFEKHSGQSLPYTRAPEAARLTKIPFGPSHTNPVPSWSWIAYEGGTSFLDPPFGKINWIVDVEFRSPDYYTAGTRPQASHGRMSSNRNEHPTRFRAFARPFDMVFGVAASGTSQILSGIAWDDPTPPHDPGGPLRCVIIGRLNSIGFSSPGSSSAWAVRMSGRRLPAKG